MTANNPWLPQQEYYKHFALNCVVEPDASAILRHLSEHIGEDKQTTLKQIALTAYGSYNSSTERKAREALETLVTKYGIPVGAHSGKAGRWLIISSEEMAHVQNELYSRAARIRERANALGRINLRPRLDKPVTARQGTLFNMPVQQPRYPRPWEV